MTIMYFKCKVNFLEIFMTCKYFFADKSFLGCWKSNKPLLKRSKSTKKKASQLKQFLQAPLLQIQVALFFMKTL